MSYESLFGAIVLTTALLASTAIIMTPAIAQERSGTHPTHALDANQALLAHLRIATGGLTARR